jgi:ornithine cyclodeaminase
MSGLECIAIDDLSSIVKSVDIISCATSSNDAIIQIEHITPGQHLDLIGSFTPQSQEVSCEVVAASSIYLDDMKATPKKAGEIYQSIEKGFITSECIKGDLITLCRDKNHKRTDYDEITLFKSVGIAIEDFASAKLLWESRY